MLTVALTVSHLCRAQRYFTSALVSPESDEEKTCESVTHGRTHDSRAKRGPLKRNEQDESQSERQPGGELGVDFVFEELEFIRFK